MIRSCRGPPRPPYSDSLLVLPQRTSNGRHRKRSSLRTRVLVRGTLHRCAKDGAWSNRFSPPSCRARAGTRGIPELVPPEYVVLLTSIHVATCESEIAKTGRRSISKDGIGRSHQDLAIRKLGNRVNPAFAQNTAVDDTGQDPTRKCGP